MKLCVLGLDALDSQLFECSDLYWFKHFRENGQWGTLYSEEMRTAPCWTSILTGWSIEHHGITHLLGYPYDGSNWFNGRPSDYIFDVLCELGGYNVGVANFPSILFARAITGGWSSASWMIGGWPSRPNGHWNFHGNIAIPDNIYSDLPDYEERALIGLRPKGAQKDWAIHELSWGEYIEWAEINAFRRMKFIETLPEVDVLMVQESVLDRAGHMLSTPSHGRLGTDNSSYQGALKLANAIIGYVVENYKPEYLSVVSDHGFQGLSEADPNRGCWHSRRGTWAIVGPNVLSIRNDTDQVNYMPTVLDALDISVRRDGLSMLIKENDEFVMSKLKALGYVT